MPHSEAVCVGHPDEIKGEAIAAFVTLQSGNAQSDELKQELRQHVRREIGGHAQPDDPGAPGLHRLLAHDR